MDNTKKLDMVQRRAVRYVHNDYSRDSSVTTMLASLVWRSLKQRRADIRLVMFYKATNELVAVDLSDHLVPTTRHVH